MPTDISEELTAYDMPAQIRKTTPPKPGQSRSPAARRRKKQAAKSRAKNRK